MSSKVNPASFTMTKLKVSRSGSNTTINEVQVHYKRSWMASCRRRGICKEQKPCSEKNGLNPVRKEHGSTQNCAHNLSAADLWYAMARFRTKVRMQNVRFGRIEILSPLLEEPQRNQSLFILAETSI